jgi:hypothetical protein
MANEKDAKCLDCGHPYPEAHRREVVVGLVNSTDPPTELKELRDVPWTVDGEGRVNCPSCGVEYHLRPWAHIDGPEEIADGKERVAKYARPFESVDEYIAAGKVLYDRLAVSAPEVRSAVFQTMVKGVLEEAGGYLGAAKEKADAFLAGATVRSECAEVEKCLECPPGTICPPECPELDKGKPLTEQELRHLHLVKESGDPSADGGEGEAPGA